MSIDFGSFRHVKAGRKAHRCEHCGGAIAIGEPSCAWAGKVEGDFTTYREHEDCREAWSALIENHGGFDHDYGHPFLYDWESDSRDDDAAFLRETYPAVAARLSWARRT
jgi:hypothetical protein